MRTIKQRNLQEDVRVVGALCARRGAVAQQSHVVVGDAREQTRLIVASLRRVAVPFEETPPEGILWIRFSWEQYSFNYLNIYLY